MSLTCTGSCHRMWAPSTNRSRADALGIVPSRARFVTDSMVKAAAKKLIRHLPTQKDKQAPLLPPISQARELGRFIGEAVGRQAIQDGQAQIAGEDALIRDSTPISGSLNTCPMYANHKYDVAAHAGLRFATIAENSLPRKQNFHLDSLNFSILRVLCISNQLYFTLPQSRHPERSASQIYLKQRALWRGVEGPRRYLLGRCFWELSGRKLQRKTFSLRQLH